MCVCVCVCVYARVFDGHTTATMNSIGIINLHARARGAWPQCARIKGMSVLHVTRHTSHVTRHTSHVTRHTSHVTRTQGPGAALSFVWITGSRLAAFYDGDRCVCVSVCLCVHLFASARVFMFVCESHLS